MKQAKKQSFRRSDLDRFRSALDQRYGELADAVDRLEIAATALPGAARPQLLGDDDVVVELQDHDFDILEHQDRALLEVTRALQRLERGTYGRCESCDGWIAPERLEILPETSVCRDCQSAGEPRFRSLPGPRPH